jgi:hypothetical protein
VHLISVDINPNMRLGGAIKPKSSSPIIVVGTYTNVKGLEMSPLGKRSTVAVPGPVHIAGS